MTKAILLVGGYGTRLRPLTEDLPKPMLPIAGLPVTEHQLMMAKKAGITEIVLATSYLSEVFLPYFGDGSDFGMSIIYATERTPLGTGGAIRNAALELGEKFLASDEPLVIFNGDIISHHHIDRQISFHLEHQADVTLHLTRVDDARAFGCVPTDSQGRVSAFLEKMENPLTNAINAGCYVFHPSVISSIAADTVVSVEREVFPALVERGGRVFGYEEQAYWLDIGTPAALLQGSRDLVGKDFIALDHSKIDRTATVTGGSAIGRNCVIEEGATIVGSIISDGAKIGRGSALENCFVARGTHVPEGTSCDGFYIAPGRREPLSL